MSELEISAMWQVVSDDSSTEAVAESTKEVRTYFQDRVNEIKKRILEGSRSIFDFVDMAVVIGALANVTSTQSTQENRDTANYIDLIKNEFIAPDEANGELIATASYCLMRCGLVHELALGEHNLKLSKKQIIGDYTISITHNCSPTGEWYTGDQAKKEIVLYAHELLSKIEECVAKCFDGESSMWNAICEKVKPSKGIKIIKVQ